MNTHKVRSGIEGLDEILGGGFPPDRLYLIEGPSGSGKTTLGLQFLLQGVKEGEKALLLGTSETQAEINDIAESHGWSLEGVEVYYYESENEIEGTDQTVFYPAEIELPKTIDALLSVVERVNPDRLVLDSLTEIRLLAREEYIYWNQLQILKRFFQRRNCTVLLTEIPASEPFSVIHSIVHGKISLIHDAPGYGSDKRHIRVMKMQNVDYSSGYHDYRINTGGLVCYPRLVAAEYRSSFIPTVVSTGNKTIDGLFGGGLDVGTSILLTGPSGTGKSLFATMCSYTAAKRGEKVGMYIFDERIHTLLQRSKGVGLDIEEYYRDGVIRITQVDPAETTPGEFSFMVKEEVDKGVSMIVLDSLNGYIYAMPEEKYLTVYLHELSSYLNQQKVTSILIATKLRTSQMEESSAFDISYIADTVVEMSYADQEGYTQKTISVYKRRGGVHDKRTWIVEITENGVELGGPLRKGSR